MSMFSSIAGMFTSNPNQPNPLEPPASVVANTTVPQANSATPPGGPAGIPPVDPALSPMAEYADLFKTDPNAKAPTPLVPDLTITPQALTAHAASIDFSKAIDPAKAALAMKGDVAAFTDIMKTVGQASYAQAAGAAATITQKALDQQMKTFTEVHLPEILRKAQVSSAVQTENPAFSNPAYAPVLSMYEGQLQQKYPTESPAQISQRAKSLMTSMAADIAKSSGMTMSVTPTASPLGGSGVKDDDWTNYLNQ